MVRNYEAMYILNPAAGEEATVATSERLKGLIEGAGTIEKYEVLGRRRLAYEINDQKEGFYVLVNFSADVEFPKEFERILKITDGVLRYLITRTDD
ncbi:MAG: 30S ribosomal protein S6 [Ruminococcaceae bacterium]|nr:30S ribosomal protein S6 [Oscillospiraceae bacterium]